MSFAFFLGARVPALEPLAAVVQQRVLETLDEPMEIALRKNGILGVDRLNICVAPLNGDPEAIRQAVSGLADAPPKTISLRGCSIRSLGKHKLVLMLADDSFKAWTVAAVAELRKAGIEAMAPQPHCSLVKITYSEKGAKKEKREANALATHVKLHEHVNMEIDIDEIVGSELKCHLQLLCIGTHEEATSE